jgi:segregation and condensation protein B
MTDPSEFANPTEPASEPEIGGEGWSGADIEQAYLKALHAIEEIAWEDGVTVEEHEVPVALPVVDEMVGGDTSAAAGHSVAAAAGIAPAATAAPSNLESPNAADGPRLAQGTERAAQSPPEELNVSPPQVIEAALFVGGGPLTARKICALLRGSFDVAFVEQTIDELNTAYVAQARPYEIRLGDGGYRLELRPEYDRLRHRVYGSGPREVRLSQDVLEVLALVAYRQPVSQQEIESHGKQNAGNLLRQLLRRELVAIARGSAGRKDVQYHTTARFLSVFGLGSLAELPQADDLAKK